MDWIISITIFAEEKKHKFPDTFGIHFISCSIPHLCGIPQNILQDDAPCLCFNDSISCYAEKYTARVYKVDIWILWEHQTSKEQIWVPNSKSSIAHSFLKMTSTSTFKQMHNHYANQVLFASILVVCKRKLQCQSHIRCERTLFKNWKKKKRRGRQGTGGKQKNLRWLP